MTAALGVEQFRGLLSDARGVIRDACQATAIYGDQPPALYLDTITASEAALASPPGAPVADAALSEVFGPDVRLANSPYDHGRRIIGIVVPADHFRYLHEGVDWIRDHLRIAPESASHTGAPGLEGWAKHGGYYIDLDEDGNPWTAKRLVDWLDRKFARHNEEPDRQAAALLRRLEELRAAPTSPPAQEERRVAQRRVDPRRVPNVNWHGSTPANPDRRKPAAPSPDGKEATAMMTKPHFPSWQNGVCSAQEVIRQIPRTEANSVGLQEAIVRLIPLKTDRQWCDDGFISLAPTPPSEKERNAAQEGPDLTGQVQSVPVIRPANGPMCSRSAPGTEGANPSASPAAASVGEKERERLGKDAQHGLSMAMDMLKSCVGTPFTEAERDQCVGYIKAAYMALRQADAPVGWKRAVVLDDGPRWARGHALEISRLDDPAIRELKPWTVRDLAKAVVALDDHIVTSDPAEFCKWTEDSDGTWNSECGVVWQFTESGVTENGYKFCHNCGRIGLFENYSDEEPADDAAAPRPAGSEG